MMDSWEDYISENIARKLEEREVYCWNNGQKELLRIRKGEYTSFQVPHFITKIHYPPNKERDYAITVYVHFIEYMVNKIVDSEGIKISNEQDYERVYNRVLAQTAQGSECHRFYLNFMRRGEVKNARERGLYGKRK